MNDWILEQLRYMHHLNCSWMIFFTEKVPDLDARLQQIVSKIINANHIAYCNFMQQEPFSELNDWQAQKDWLLLEQENFRAFTSYFHELETGITNGKTAEMSNHERFMWFHLLKQNAYYIGQLQLICGEFNLEFPAENLRLVQ